MPRARVVVSASLLALIAAGCGGGSSTQPAKEEAGGDSSGTGGEDAGDSGAGSQDAGADGSRDGATGEGGSPADATVGDSTVASDAPADVAHAEAAAGDAGSKDATVADAGGGSDATTTPDGSGDGASGMDAAPDAAAEAGQDSGVDAGTEASAGCTGNPCGDGGTCVPDGSAYTCNCGAGYVSVNGACVCDMNGTFASQFTIASSWSGVTDVEDATNAPSYSWSLRTQTYDSSGNLVVKTTPCGVTAPDVCGNGFPDITTNEAYAQYLPTSDYGLSTMPVVTVPTISLPNALPGQAYTEPQTALLLGISLTDPLGAWPAADSNVGGSSPTNGAAWVDSDGDGQLGVTTYSVPPGGISMTTSPNPPVSYGSTSTACPRGDAGATRELYDYWPAYDVLPPHRITRFYDASRTISSLSGTITSCDSSGVSLIEGTVGGPDTDGGAGQMHTDVRIGGCAIVTAADAGAADAGGSACAAVVVNQYDGQPQTQHVTSASFIIKRVAGTTTCAQVRAMSFP